MKTRLLIGLLVAIVLTSCAGLTRVTVPCSPVNMGDRDMETERKVSYTLTKTYFLGIGGMSERARNTDIIEQLFRKANLKKNEALAYIGVTQNINNYLGIVIVAKFTATGYVIRPVEEEHAEEGQRINEVPRSIATDHEQTNGTPTVKYVSGEYEKLLKKANEFVRFKEYIEITKESKLLRKNGIISKEQYDKLKIAIDARFDEIQKTNY